jgi:hypothetical protein
MPNEGQMPTEVLKVAATSRPVLAAGAIAGVIRSQGGSRFTRSGLPPSTRPSRRLPSRAATSCPGASTWCAFRPLSTCRSTDKTGPGSGSWWRCANAIPACGNPYDHVRSTATNRPSTTSTAATEIKLRRMQRNAHSKASGAEAEGLPTQGLQPLRRPHRLHRLQRSQPATPVLVGVGQDLTPAPYWHLRKAPAAVDDGAETSPRDRAPALRGRDSALNPLGGDLRSRSSWPRR